MNSLKKLSDKHAKALYRFRLYCTKCNTLLLESDPFTRKDLISNWDTIVLTSPVVPCKSCNHSVPNFYITIKIVSLRTGREYLPKDFIPNPKQEYSSIIESIVGKASAQGSSETSNQGSVETSTQGSVETPNQPGPTESKFIA